MDAGKKAGGMKEGQNQMPGMQVKELGLQELSGLASKIRERCRYDALNTEKNRAAVSERKSELSEVKHDFLRSAAHMVAFAAMHEGEVVGFLSVEKTPAGKIASIKDLWTSLPGTSQRPIVGKLLNAAKHYLSDHGYPRLRAEPISASADFSVVTANPEIGRFMRITNPDSEEALDISIAPEEVELPKAANDNFPKAANDNEPKAEEKHQREAA